MTTTETENELDPIQSCLALADPEALSCIEELIKNWPEEEACKPSLVLLTQGDCVPCEEEHEVHAAAIAAGIMEVVDIHSPRGTEIAKRNEIEQTPAVLLLDCTDTIIEQEGASTTEEEGAPVASV